MCRNHSITFKCGHTPIYRTTICVAAQEIEEMNENGENQTHPYYVRMLKDCEKDEAKGDHAKERKDVDCPGCLNKKEKAEDNNKKKNDKLAKTH